MIQADNAPNEKGQAYTEMLQLFNKLIEWNPAYTFDNAINLVSACQQLLLNYNTAIVKFLNDKLNNEIEPTSVLSYITDDALEQWDMHKSFYETYNVYVF
ncbi:TPA: hypothetical protein RPV34_002780 [Staphylococcus aureus]|uniref:Uncharacterized protein n=1 Tax=Staphylococcus phage SA46-CL1 TaxID=2591106 RepID=A0A6M2YE67_9CAUD|nr:hypothetical protein KNU60_gp01 [Staphylococcus phage SA46-CL1]QCW21986.1 hypothetical protein SA46CTH2_1 [Staphylococcus phage SA46-CTH2]QDH84820.1 hypothetical protein SA03CTH2_19 [Staphylococcus phage SA03-CTH2]QEG07426.1 hypothetical protein SA1CTA1_19 [Staphylococcus phage SA1-CTA1]QEG07427.1 hypothetical protein SA30CTH2_1 [Staphylococcus phage SA30-CTH2]QEG07446.1 hypothetical protein SA46CTH4_1 [Staphylococcus phage SA46-CTH4]QEM41184.1 hypothetical protein SA44CTH7_1 [Staphylococc